ncbi:MAG: CHAD domain-containing protein [Flavobacteriales bacterium]
MRTLLRFRRSVEEARCDQDRETLHRLRVRAKRVRSLLRFLSFLSNDTAGPKGAIRRTKALFKTSGAVRQVQVSASLLRTLSQAQTRTLNAGVVHVRRKERALNERLHQTFERLRPKDLQRLELHALRALHERGKTQLREGAQAFIRSELHHATRLTRAADAHLHLHEVRKHLKHVLHLFDLLDPGIPRPDGLAKLLDRLGDWHDAVVLQDMLLTMKDHRKERDQLLAAVEHHLQLQQKHVLRLMRKSIGKWGIDAAWFQGVWFKAGLTDL